MDEGAAVRDEEAGFDSVVVSILAASNSQFNAPRSMMSESSRAYQALQAMASELVLFLPPLPNSFCTLFDYLQSSDRSSTLPKP